MVNGKLYWLKSNKKKLFYISPSIWNNKTFITSNRAANWLRKIYCLLVSKIIAETLIV